MIAFSPHILGEEEKAGMWGDSCSDFAFMGVICDFCWKHFNLLWLGKESNLQVAGFPSKKKNTFIAVFFFNGMNMQKEYRILR